MTSKTRRIVVGALAAVVAVVALDSVYLLGYRHGREEERRAWAASGRVTLRGLTGRTATTVVNTPDPRAYRGLGHSSPQPNAAGDAR